MSDPALNNANEIPDAQRDTAPPLHQHPDRQEYISLRRSDEVPDMSQASIDMVVSEQSDIKPIRIVLDDLGHFLINNIGSADAFAANYDEILKYQGMDFAELLKRYGYTEEEFTSYFGPRITEMAKNVLKKDKAIVDEYNERSKPANLHNADYVYPVNPSYLTDRFYQYNIDKRKGFLKRELLAVRGDYEAVVGEIDKYEVIADYVRNCFQVTPRFDFESTRDFEEPGMMPVQEDLSTRLLGPLKSLSKELVIDILGENTLGHMNTLMHRYNTLISKQPFTEAEYSELVEMWKHLHEITDTLRPKNQAIY